MQIVVAGEPVVLLAGRAILWNETVVVADVHLGKGDTFRHFGLPLPDADLDRDLHRLSALVTEHAARRLLVLGDWIHGEQGLNDDVTARVGVWRAGLDCEVELVPGNHDKVLPPASWRMSLREDGHTEGPFRFVHKPGRASGAYTWCGHVHPGIIAGRGRLAERFACFWIAPELGMLPAFGSFTGSFTVRPTPDDTVVAITSDGLVRLQGGS